MYTDSTSVSKKVAYTCMFFFQLSLCNTDPSLVSKDHRKAILDVYVFHCSGSEFSCLSWVCDSRVTQTRSKYCVKLSCGSFFLLTCKMCKESGHISSTSCINSFQLRDYGTVTKFWAEFKDANKIQPSSALRSSHSLNPFTGE